MRKVAIAGYATTKFRRKSEVSLFETACDPCRNILLEHEDLKKEIDAVLFASCSVEQYSSSIISEMLGLSPQISHRIDNLCNSGTSAIACAFSYIASGLCDSVLVIGAEKVDSPGRRLGWDVTRGEYGLPVHWAALFAKAHMRKYGTTEEQMAMVSVRNHLNATKNPNALFGEPITFEDVLNSRQIVSPIKLLDCSSLCTGSSAILLVSDKMAKTITENPIWIRGIGQQTNFASFSKVANDLTSIHAAKQASAAAYRMAATDPRSIDVVELHDAFTILEILAYEDLHFAKKGEGGRFVNQDNISINPRGGILGCGHPIGATGVAQVAEVAMQLDGKAGLRQVRGCKTGLVHNIAAAGSSATVLILGIDQ
ncbi:MAG TPA: thiolase family protein [Candidatus Nitrosopolaris sp.]|nr:thiolase family protein [Candidatus Nitrosopolaris sp.]